MFIGGFPKSSVNFVKIRRRDHAAVALYLTAVVLITFIAVVQRLKVQALQWQRNLDFLKMGPKHRKLMYLLSSYRIAYVLT